jgi:hypothetical protein
MPGDRTRTLRGAVAGAAAAAVWAAQEPLDRRLFGVAYSDVELLGRAVVRGRSAAWVPAGWVLHLANGALFGAAYAQVAPSLRGPASVRGVAAGMLEHLLTWPATRLVGRLHPQPARFPRLWGDRQAFAQATWRHVLFGALLGTIERRLNA